MKRPRKTKIICTIGPATRSVERIAEMLRTGMNIARINFSHETHKQHGATIEMIRRAEEQSGIPVAIMLDTKGPEIRTGTVADGGVIEFHSGRSVTLTTHSLIAAIPSSRDDPVRLSVSYVDLPQLVGPDDHIYIADGVIDLRVLRVEGTEIATVVQSGGMVGSHKNVNVPGVSLPLPAISDRDAADIRFGLAHGIDFVAASFVRSAADVLEIRHLIEQALEEGEGERGSLAPKGLAPKARIIAKIENNEGVEWIEEIAEAADGVMIARGDLGIQLPMERVPLVQKRIIGICNRVGVPVVTATQMLESMVNNPRPTRAEMTDVANAIYDGTDAVMLSGETAVGAHPIKSITTLDRIACAVEESTEFMTQCERSLANSSPASSSSDAVAKSSCVLARDISASCIVIPSVRGNGPRLLARYRSPVPIIAVVAQQAMIRQLMIHWGVIPLVVHEARSTEEMLRNAMDSAKKHGYVRQNEWVVTVAGLPLQSPITLNTVSAQYIGTVLRRGRRAYGMRAEGVVRVLDGAADAQAQVADHAALVESTPAVSDSAPAAANRDSAPALAASSLTDTEAAPPAAVILVLERLTEAYLPLLRSAGGVISERIGTLTAAQVREQNAQIVIIEEVEGAREFFHNGQQVQMNGLEKTVYER